MQIALKKETAGVSEMIVNQSATLLVEGDVIVPDIKPDIKEILLTEATAVITSHSCTEGHLSFSGVATVKILYLPDAEDACPKSIETKFDFKDVSDLTGDGNLDLHIKAACEHIEFSLINSRKLNMKLVVSVNTRGYCKKEMALFTEAGEETPLQIKTCGIEAYQVVADTTKDLVISEQVEIPSAKPDAEEIIRMSIRALKGDCKIMSGKMIVKGTLIAQTLYRDFESHIEIMEHEIPFSEMIELEGLDDSCLCNVSYEVKEVYYRLKDDANGDSRMVSLDAVLQADVIASKIKEAFVIDDCYSTEGNLVTEWEKLLYEECLADGISHLNLKEILSVPESAPRAETIYSLECKPKVQAVMIADDKLVIQGKLTVFVLYAGAEGEEPMYSLVGEFDFEHTVPAEGADEKAFCECGITDQNISFSLNAASEIELRCVLEFYTRVIKKREVRMVCGGELSDTEEEVISRGPVIYFARKEDSLWDVAKRYGVVQDSILKLNHLDNERLLPGQKLLIPRR